LRRSCDPTKRRRKTIRRRLYTRSQKMASLPLALVSGWCARPRPHRTRARRANGRKCTHVSFALPVSLMGCARQTVNSTFPRFSAQLLVCCPRRQYFLTEVCRTVHPTRKPLVAPELRAARCGLCSVLVLQSYIWTLFVHVRGFRRRARSAPCGGVSRRSSQ
jgi:hypothetical protein